MQLKQHIKSLLFWFADYRCVSLPLVSLWTHSYACWPRSESRILSLLRRHLRVPARRRVLTTMGFPMYVDPKEFIGRKIVLDGCYESESVHLLSQILKEGMIVFDIGAHWGQYTLLASACTGSAGQVHVFEPDPANFAMLRSNVRLNRCRNVRCNEYALSESSGYATLYLGSLDSTGTNSLRPQPYNEKEKNQIKVTTRTIDSYVSEHNLQKLDFIKMDVEGAELPLLLGGAKTIVSFRPIIMLEISILGSAFGYTTADLIQFFRNNNYMLFRAGSLPLPVYSVQSEESDHFNVLAVPMQLVERFSKAGIINPS